MAWWSAAPCLAFRDACLETPYWRGVWRGGIYTPSPRPPGAAGGSLRPAPIPRYGAIAPQLPCMSRIPAPPRRLRIC